MTWLQHWTDVLFLHFPVAAEELAQRVGGELEIDTFDGHGWVSYVLFRLKLRPPGLPYVPCVSSLLELNVRTYIRYRDQRGIVFLKMYADNWLAIWASRMLTPLCYEPAAMRMDCAQDGSWRFICAPRNGGGELAAEFDVLGDPYQPAAKSLEAWLLERYRLFVPRGGRELLVASVEHPPWRASPVDLRVVLQTLGECQGLPALAHFSSGVAATFGAFESAALADDRHSACAATSAPARAAARCAGR